MAFRERATSREVRWVLLLWHRDVLAAATKKPRTHDQALSAGARNGEVCRDRGRCAVALVSPLRCRTDFAVDVMIEE